MSLSKEIKFINHLPRIIKTLLIYVIYYIIYYIIYELNAFNN